MSYSPPPGNSIAFVFSTSGYAPPTGNAIAFVFGGSSGGTVNYGPMVWMIW